MILKAITYALRGRNSLYDLSVDARYEGLILQHCFSRLTLHSLLAERVNDECHDGVQDHDAKHHEIADVIGHSLVPQCVPRHCCFHYRTESDDAISCSLVQNILRANYDVISAIISKLVTKEMEANGSIDEGDNDATQKCHRQRAGRGHYASQNGLESSALAKEVQHQEAKEPVVPQQCKATEHKQYKAPHPAFVLHGVKDCPDD